MRRPSASAAARASSRVAYVIGGAPIGAELGSGRSMPATVNERRRGFPSGASLLNAGRWPAASSSSRPDGFGIRLGARFGPARVARRVVVRVRVFRGFGRFLFGGWDAVELHESLYGHLALLLQRVDFHLHRFRVDGGVFEFLLKRLHVVHAVGFQRGVDDELVVFRAAFVDGPGDILRGTVVATRGSRARGRRGLGGFGLHGGIGGAGFGLRPG